jgi:hypothetical protein
MRTGRTTRWSTRFDLQLLPRRLGLGERQAADRRECGACGTVMGVILSGELDTEILFDYALGRGPHAPFARHARRGSIFAPAAALRVLLGQATK